MIPFSGNFLRSNLLFLYFKYIMLLGIGYGLGHWMLVLPILLHEDVVVDVVVVVQLQSCLL